MFSLEEVECIGACCWAPRIQVNYDFHDEPTPDHVPGISMGYRDAARGRRERPPMPRLVSHPDEVKVVTQALWHGRGEDRSLP